MKTFLTISISLFLLALPRVTDACGPYNRRYLAKDYNMFRVCGDDMLGDRIGLITPEDEKRKENLTLWAQLTSVSIPLSNISSVVYNWDLNAIQVLNDATHNRRTNYKTDNKFAQWIVANKDTDISEFLLLAKRNEMVRSKCIDPWYYAVDGDEVNTELQDIISKGCSYRGKRLRDRYALQILRAMFSCHQYDNCINFWNKNNHYFQDNILRKMAAGYVAGAYFHSGHKAKAEEIYLEIEDLYSAYMCQAREEGDYYEWMYKYHPNNKLLIKKLQGDIHAFECMNEYDDTREKYEKLYFFVRRVAIEEKCCEMASWYYAAAFLADKVDERNQAIFFIKKAKNAQCGKELQDAIQVLDFYLTVKYAPIYDADFEEYVYTELCKLDSKIVRFLDKKTRENISRNGYQNHDMGISQYYWNDMMRKIVIGELVPLCIRSDYKTRALQYLNMADNRIFNLVTKHYVNNNGVRSCHYDKPITGCTLKNVSECRNLWDYTNDYFINLDSIGVKYVQRLEERMRKPSCPLDSFLNERSYTDQQYLCEIIGTQLIASMRYKEAIEYLNRVSDAFNKTRNVFAYCNVDPFTGKKAMVPDAAYKLHFAEKMASLESKAKHSADPNDRAEALQTYAWGLQSSIGAQCWPLTSYYWGSFYSYPFYSQNQRNLTERIRAKSQQVKQQSLAMFTDRERAAQAYYKWKMFRSAAAKCKGTKVANYIRAHCDNLRDYIVSPTLPPRLAETENREYDW